MFQSGLLFLQRMLAPPSEETSSGSKTEPVDTRGLIVKQKAEAQTPAPAERKNFISNLADRRRRDLSAIAAMVTQSEAEVREMKRITATNLLRIKDMLTEVGLSSQQTEVFMTAVIKYGDECNAEGQMIQLLAKLVEAHNKQSALVSGTPTLSRTFGEACG